MSALVVLKRSVHELVIVKPAGLASELPGRDTSSARALATQLAPGSMVKLPHRLDRVTRGILVLCLSDEAVAFHNAEIAARRWEKFYLARVAPNDGVDPHALLGKHRAFLTAPKGLAEDARATIVRSGGKPAWMEILAVAPTTTAGGGEPRVHVLIRLLTGRFHQVRVMCAGLGLPLAGDPLYDPRARDPRELYLEHVMLRYTDYDTRKPSTMFVPDDLERGPLAPAIAEVLASLAAG